jgi:hypothetical protein
VFPLTKDEILGIATKSVKKSLVYFAGAVYSWGRRSFAIFEPVAKARQDARRLRDADGDGVYPAKAGRKSEE